MKLNDIDACIDLLARHPEFPTLYGSQREPLRAVLRRLLASLGFLAIVLEAVDSNQVEMFGVGAVAFLTDDFASAAKSSPYFWLGPTIIQRLMGGESPVLSDEAFLRAAAGDGLTVFAWPLGFRSEYLRFPEVLNYLMGSFMQEIRGYKLKEFLGQTTDVEGARISLHSGAILLTSRGTYKELPPVGEQALLLEPHLLVITRQSALQRVGAWSSSLFIYADPIIGFAKGEQRLLSEALRGLTDEELAVELQVSLSAIKKNWRSIYTRVERAGLPILPALTESREDGDRGKGKRHRLLNYVREHPEELRPFSMKLLRKNRASTTDGKPAAQTTPRRRVGRRRSNSSHSE